MERQPFKTTATILLRGLREERNDDAWGEFVARYRPVLIGYFRNLGWHDADANDATQMTLAEFCRAYRAGQYDREKGRLSSWLLGIARHQAGTFRRKRKRDLRALGESAMVDLPDAARMTAIWEKQHERAIFERAYDLLRTTTRLDERTLRAFDMLVVQGMPAAAVAKECGMTLEQTYVARSRAAKKLHGLIQQLTKSYQEHP